MCAADHPSILLLRVCLREVLTDVREKMAARILPAVAVLFTVVKNWKQYKCHNK